VNLTAELQRIGLNLDIESFYGEQTPPTEASTIITYVLIGAVAVLGVVLVILSVTCWFNSRR